MVGNYLWQMLTSRRGKGGQGHWEWASIDLAERRWLRACRRESNWRWEDLEQMYEQRLLDSVRIFCFLPPASWPMPGMEKYL